MTHAEAARRIREEVKGWEQMKGGRALGGKAASLIERVLWHGRQERLEGKSGECSHK